MKNSNLVFTILKSSIDKSGVLAKNLKNGQTKSPNLLILEHLRKVIL